MHPSRLRFVAFFCLFVAAFGLGFASRFGLERWLHGPEASSEETSPQLRAAGATDGAVALRPEAAGGAAAGAAAPDPSDRPGKWRRARSAEEDVTPSAPVDPAQLTAVPYLQGYRRASGEYGVTVHDPRATPGLNLVTSGHAPEAVLMEMDGKVLHRWRSSLRRVWPDLPDRPRMQKLEYWRRALPLEDGSLLAIFEINGLVKLDRESKLLWAYRSDVHHDLFVAPDDTIWVLDRRGRLDHGDEVQPTLGTGEGTSVGDGELGEARAVQGHRHASGHLASFPGWALGSRGFDHAHPGGSA